MMIIFGLDPAESLLYRPPCLHVGGPFATNPVHNRDRLQLSELSAELETKYAGAHPELCSLRDALHVPGIIHSTVMRLASPPSDADRLAEGLARIAERWEPATVRVAAISLVHEQHPYMHLDLEGAEAHCYRLPLD